jgi:hypothetical protein
MQWHSPIGGCLAISHRSGDGPAKLMQQGGRCIGSLARSGVGLHVPGRSGYFLAGLGGALKTRDRIDNILAFILQCVAAMADLTNPTQKGGSLALPAKALPSFGYPYISYRPTARFCHFC